jgi:regulator of replication initiation timing
LFQATTKRIFSKLDNLQKILEQVVKNQGEMKTEIKSIQGEIAILAYDQECIDVSRILNFEYFANARNTNNVL